MDGGAILIWSAIAAIASAVAAIVSVIIAYRAFRYAQAMDDPIVLVRVVHDDLRPTILMIQIENVGRSSAYDVKFTCSSKIPSSAYGIERLTREQQFMTRGPLVNGIPVLAAGDSRRMNWGQMGGLDSHLKGRRIQIHTKYSNERRREFNRVNVLEIESYWDTDASEREPALKLERQLKEVVHQTKRLADSVASVSNKYEAIAQPSVVDASSTVSAAEV